MQQGLRMLQKGQKTKSFYAAVDDCFMLTMASGLQRIDGS
jgi:hypothetical protein